MIIQQNETIYEAVANYFRKMISLGVLKEGDALPSVREVAMAEKINPNTVVRAYGILLEEGLITSIPKKGYFVTGMTMKADVRPLRKALQELLSLGFSKKDIIAALEAMEGEDQ